MSALEDVAASLDEVSRPLPSLAETLRQRSARIRLLAGQIQDLGRRVPGGVDFGQVAEALLEAAGRTESTAQSLLSAAQEGRNWIQRVVSAESSPGVAAGDGPRDGGAGGTSEVTSTDAAALGDYTGAGYSELNASLRGGSTMSSSVEARAEAVSTALAKLPDRPGASYRGTRLSAEQLAAYVPGLVVTEAGFTSSAADPTRAFGGNAVFLIDGKHGKDVSPYSEWPESEILFDKGSHFLVIGHEVRPNGQHVIQMREV